MQVYIWRLSFQKTVFNNTHVHVCQKYVHCTSKVCHKEDNVTYLLLVCLENKRVKKYRSFPNAQVFASRRMTKDILAWEDITFTRAGCCGRNWLICGWRPFRKHIIGETFGTSGPGERLHWPDVDRTVCKLSP